MGRLALCPGTIVVTSRSTRFQSASCGELHSRRGNKTKGGFQSGSSRELPIQGRGGVSIRFVRRTPTLHQRLVRRSVTTQRNSLAVLDAKALVSLVMDIVSLTIICPLGVLATLANVCRCGIHCTSRPTRPSPHFDAPGTFHVIDVHVMSLYSRRVLIIIGGRRRLDTFTSLPRGRGHHRVPSMICTVPLPVAFFLPYGGDERRLY